jgi:hypothetical protein
MSHDTSFLSTVVDILMVKTVVDILMVLGFLVPNKKSFEKVYWSKKTKGPKQNCQNSHNGVSNKLPHEWD